MNDGQQKKLGKVSKKYRRMSELYKIFSKDWEHLCDYSEEMLVEHYNHETHGMPISKNNGYSLGQKWLNVQVSMWKEDIRDGLFYKWELYQDPKYPHWWLDSIFKDPKV